MGPYSADIVARDTSRRTDVVIENQLGKTDHDHLGKLLTYTSVLNAGAVAWRTANVEQRTRPGTDIPRVRYSKDSESQRAHDGGLTNFRSRCKEPGTIRQKSRSSSAYTRAVWWSFYRAQRTCGVLGRQLDPLAPCGRRSSVGREVQKVVEIRGVSASPKAAARNDRYGNDIGRWIISGPHQCKLDQVM